MLALLRMSLWLIGVFFAVSPVIFIVARSPGQIRMLFEIASYHHLVRDLLFAAIAVLAIGLTDAFESITGAIEGSNTQTKKISLALLIAAVIVIQLFVSSAWASGLPAQYNPDDMHVIIYLFCSSVLCAMLARLNLLFGS